MKRYILFAGCNGVGKSTLYHTNQLVLNMPNINVDNTVREFGNWRNPSDVFKAGKITLQRIKENFSKGISFSQETTLCGKTIWKNIEIARGLGYKIEMYYVGVNTVELAKKRVKQRVQKGGHGIPDTDIERRYKESIHNITKAITVCDVVEIFDNSEAFIRIARYESGKNIFKSQTLPEWFK